MTSLFQSASPLSTSDEATHHSSPGSGSPMLTFDDAPYQDSIPNSSVSSSHALSLSTSNSSPTQVYTFGFSISGSAPSSLIDTIFFISFPHQLLFSF